MALTAEQIAEARKEGYTDAEILQHYAESKGIDLKAARDEGYSDSEILSHVSGAAVEPQVAEAPEEKSMLSSPTLSATLGAGAGAVYSAKTLPIKAAKALGSSVADRISGMQRAPVAPPSYTTPAGINVEQTPGGMHPGAVGNAQFNVEQQQANKLHQNVPSGFEAKGTSRILTPVGMQEPPAALGGQTGAPRGGSILAQKRAEGWPIVRETTQAVKSAIPAVGGLAQRAATSAPATGALIGYNLQQAENARHAGDTTGAAIGYTGAASQLLPKMKGRLGLIKPLVGVGAAGINALRGQPEGYREGGVTKRDLLMEGIKAAKTIFTPKETKIIRASEALGPHEGKWLNVTQSDRMRSTGGDLGGPGFSRFQTIDPRYAEAQAAWGVGKKPTASAIVNVNKRFPEGQAIWSPMIGSETQHHSNQHVFDMLKEEYNRQVGRGMLTPELRQRSNQRLQTAPAYKGRFDPNFDIGNPEMLADAAKTFDRRGALAEVMSGQGVGGQKGSIIDYPGIMQEMTDPMTIGAPTHSIGTRLFNLSGDVEHRPDLHSAFPYILKGEDMGVAFNPVPKELALSDWMNQFKEFKGRAPGYYDMTRTVPSQQITDKYLRSLEEAGHAEGGAIHMAKGKLAGGLSMMPKKQQEDLQNVEQKYNYFTNRPAYQKAEMIGEALSDVPELAASFHPGYGLGYAGGALYDAVTNTGDYGNAAMETAFNAPGVLRPIGAAAKAAAPTVRAALPAIGGLGMLGAPQAAEAGQGSKLKQIIGGVMDDYAPKAKAPIVPGAAHVYGPQVPAGTQWMRDYQPQSMMQTAQQAAQPKITYMGKYLSPTPERMAAEKAQREADIRGAIENRKAQWLAQSRARGIPEEQIMEEMNSPWGAPWMP